MEIKKNKRQTKTPAHFLTPFPQFQTSKPEIFLTEQLLSASASVTPSTTQSRWDRDSSCLEAVMQAVGIQAAGAQTAHRQHRSLTGGCEPPLRCCVWAVTQPSPSPLPNIPSTGCQRPQAAARWDAAQSQSFNFLVIQGHWTPNYRRAAVRNGRAHVQAADSVTYCISIYGSSSGDQITSVY